MQSACAQQTGVKQMQKLSEEHKVRPPLAYRATSTAPPISGHAPCPAPPHIARH